MSYCLSLLSWILWPDRTLVLKALMETNTPVAGDGFILKRHRKSRSDHCVGRDGSWLAPLPSPVSTADPPPASLNWFRRHSSDILRAPLSGPPPSLPLAFLCASRRILAPSPSGPSWGENAAAEPGRSCVSGCFRGAGNAEEGVRAWAAPGSRLQATGSIVYQVNSPKCHVRSAPRAVRQWTPWRYASPGRFGRRVDGGVWKWQHRRKRQLRNNSCRTRDVFHILQIPTVSPCTVMTAGFASSTYF